MKMTIETIPTCPIAYIRQIGAYGEENTRTMEQLKQWAKANNILSSKAVIFGIAQDNPQTTPPEECRYDACIALEEEPVVKDDTMRYGEIAGGRYAVFTLQHTAEAVRNAWAAIFPAVAESGCIPDEARPVIERYALELVEQNLCEICVPII